MERTRVLLVDTNEDFLARLAAILNDCGCRVASSAPGSDALRYLHTSDIDVLVVGAELPDGRIEELVKTSRLRYPGMPLEVVIAVEEEKGLSRAADFGADDVILKSASSAEIIARFDAATIRLEAQRRLVEEREYYRKAVREEEAISTGILDRNNELERACRSLESIKRELERSNQRLQELARFDMLSGLLNRVSLFSSMDVEIERSRRKCSSLAGFMTDIDNFKNINDNWGHPFGDAVIRTFGERLTQSLRKYDYAGRYGGEEFFIILPETELGGAQMIAERFRKRLSGSPVRYGNEEMPVTASIGVALFKPEESRDAWITRADQAMYLAKQQGRNRTCVLA
ncbi:MAG TPA: diguanylate cyclase [Spirochaetia bacterium]|nr:diguanylate cyclase [Spirochaetia bacterium]